MTGSEENICDMEVYKEIAIICRSVFQFTEIKLLPMCISLLALLLSLVEK